MSKNKQLLKVLIFDVETSPMLAHAWNRFPSYMNMEMLVRDTHMLTWSAKWLGEDDIYFDSLHYHKLHKKDPHNDSIIVKSILDMVDSADIVITHNGDKFDLPYLRGRALFHGYNPPSHVRSVDTLKVVKANFKLTSNRLNDIGIFLKVGKKVDTGGFDLWRQISLHQSIEHYDKMVEYNKQDVWLLEDVYNKLKPWIKNHPNLFINFNSGETMTCTNCGSENVRKNGSYQTNLQIYQKYVCKDCNTHLRDGTGLLDKTQTKNILRRI